MTLKRIQEQILKRKMYFIPSWLGNAGEIMDLARDSRNCQASPVPLSQQPAPLLLCLEAFSCCWNPL